MRTQLAPTNDAKRTRGRGLCRGRKAKIGIDRTHQQKTKCRSMKVKKEKPRPEDCFWAGKAAEPNAGELKCNAHQQTTWQSGTLNKKLCCHRRENQSQKDRQQKRNVCRENKKRERSHNPQSAKTIEKHQRRAESLEESGRARSARE